MLSRNRGRRRRHRSVFPLLLLVTKERYFLFSCRNGPNIHIYIIYFFGFNERKELFSFQNTIRLIGAYSFMLFW